MNISHAGKEDIISQKCSYLHLFKVFREALLGKLYYKLKASFQNDAEINYINDLV